MYDNKLKMAPKNMRNFVIISHIDHGKSTLADRFLEVTGTIEGKKMRPQFLDMMDLEREKGITIKMQPVRMVFRTGGEDHVLNLIDTPGHVDFTYEVSRALAAVEGAVLLVDATKGIQAQTLANLDLAKKQGIKIIPAVNKIDMAGARIEETVSEMAELLNIDESEILQISGKTGTNVDKLLERIVEQVPPPKIDKEKPFRGLIFDSRFDSFKGIIAFVRVIEGSIHQYDKIQLVASGAVGEIKELGFFKPEMTPQKEISSGEIGYIATGIKEPNKIRVGDTIAIYSDNKVAEGLPGYKDVQPMVFASLYPESSDDFDILKDALSRLKLSDPALTYEPESKDALGRGFRCGFLGTLHTEIISERLKREFDLDLVISTPSVVYKITDNQNNEKLIYSAGQWPEQTTIKKSMEPWVFLEILAPITYIGPLSDVLKSLRGTYIDTKYLGTEKVILSYEMPLRDIITNLYDKIKGVSQGYASMNYFFSEYKESQLIKLDVFIAGEKEDAFARIVPEDRSYAEGKTLVEKIKEFLPPQLFSVAIQAVIGGKVIARETIKAQRKDVTGYLYGGDYSRKRKLLEKQKKGKKKMKAEGRVRVPAKVFLEVFRG